jgi:hypothetical protein
MSKLKPSKDSRTIYDKKTGAVRSFFGADLVAPIPQSKRSLTSVGKSDDFLKVNSGLFKLEALTLEKADLRKGSAKQAVHYSQLHNGIPVFGARLTVGMRKNDGAVTSAVNTLDYELPETLKPSMVKVNSGQVTDLIRSQFGSMFKGITLGEPKLYIYRHITGEVPQPPRADRPIRRTMLKMGTGIDNRAYIAWQVFIDTNEPNGNWELWLDAADGKLLVVRDRNLSITRKAYVFSPDPVRSKQDTTLSWSSTEAVLNNERLEVDLQNLDDPGANPCKLEGEYVECKELDTPTFAQPQSNGDFKYGAKDRKFLSVMAYHYLDRLITYLLGLGCTDYNNSAAKVQVDAQACDGADNSSSGLNASGTLIIKLGEGGVPDASDPAVPVHEYGHSIYRVLGVASTYPYEYEQGWCDFLAACWLDRFNEHQFERSEVFPWDNCPAVHWDSTRRLDLTTKFNDAGFASYGHDYKGSVYATALWDWYLNIGGNSGDANVRRWAADEAIRTYLDMIVTTGVNSPPATLANGLIDADAARTGGLYQKVIWDAFRRRGLWTNFTPVGNVDLYIRDSDTDTGEHASPQVHWTSPDIWVRNNPPAVDPNDPNDPNYGENPEDGHQPPINNVPNYLYVRVRNRGSQVATANNFSVEAFHCNPATAMLWPTHFQSMGTQNIAGAIPANGGSVRVGPFVWTPQIVDHECLLAVVKGTEDPTIADAIQATGSVDHWKLVRFDNNVGQRNVSPVPSTPGGKTKMSFLIRGTTHPSTNTLRIDASALPADTKISVRIARSITDSADNITGMSIIKQTERWSTLALTGGIVGMVIGFPLATNEEKSVSLEIDFSYQAVNLKRYSIIAGQEQDGVMVGQLTIEITAVKDSEDYFYGNVRSHELHLLNCEFRKIMSPRNQVPFLTVKDALARGYNGCKFCMPEYNTD